MKFRYKYGFYMSGYVAGLLIGKYDDWRSWLGIAIGILGYIFFSWTVEQRINRL